MHIRDYLRLPTCYQDHYEKWNTLLNIYEAYEAMDMEDRLQLVLQTIQSAPRTAALRTSRAFSVFGFSIWFHLLCSYSNKSDTTPFGLGGVGSACAFFRASSRPSLSLCLLGQFFRCLHRVICTCRLFLCLLSLFFFLCSHASTSLLASNDVAINRRKLEPLTECPGAGLSTGRNRPRWSSEPTPFLLVFAIPAIKLNSIKPSSARWRGYHYINHGSQHYTMHKGLFRFQVGWFVCKCTESLFQIPVQQFSLFDCQVAVRYFHPVEHLALNIWKVGDDKAATTPQWRRAKPRFGRVCCLGPREHLEGPCSVWEWRVLSPEQVRKWQCSKIQKRWKLTVPSFCRPAKTVKCGQKDSHHPVRENIFAALQKAGLICMALQ